MCIAIYSLKGTNVPSEDILRTCFRNNPDGAGFAFNKDGKVQIVKGFMDFDTSIFMTIGYMMTYIRPFP